MTKSNNKISSFGTMRTFMKTGTCSEGIMNVLDRAFDNPMELEEHGVMPLAGGIAQQGYQCGLLWGSSLAAGAQAYKLYGSGQQGEAAALTASKKIVESFEERNKSINCLEITDTDWKKTSDMIKNFLRGGPVTCMRLTAKTAHSTFEEINSALLEKPASRSCCRENCAAKLAKKMGLSDKHAVMASTFAGGIGLSGGACGALGAAVWIMGMSASKNGVDYKQVNAKSQEIIEKFLEASDYEFECSEIVGRKFKDMDDHGRHVQEGGCSEIIDALVNAAQKQISKSSKAA